MRGLFKSSFLAEKAVWINRLIMLLRIFRKTQLKVITVYVDDIECYNIKY